MDKTKATSSSLPERAEDVDEHVHVQQLLSSSSWQKRLEEARAKREKVLAEQGASDLDKGDLTPAGPPGTRPWETPSAGMANVLVMLREAQNHQAGHRPASGAAQKSADLVDLDKQEAAEARPLPANNPLQLTQALTPPVAEEAVTGGPVAEGPVAEGPVAEGQNRPPRAVVVASRDASDNVAPPVGNATRSTGEGKTRSKIRWGRVAFVIAAFAFGLGLGLGLANFVAGLGGAVITAKTDVSTAAMPTAAPIVNPPVVSPPQLAPVAAKPATPEPAKEETDLGAAPALVEAPQITVTLAPSIPQPASELAFGLPSKIDDIVPVSAPLAVAPRLDNDIAPDAMDPAGRLPTAADQPPEALSLPKAATENAIAPPPPTPLADPDPVQTASLAVPQVWDGQDLPQVDLTPAPAPVVATVTQEPIKLLVPTRPAAESLESVTEGLVSAGYQLRDPITVNFTVSANHVRFYHSVDEAAAKALGAKIGGPVKEFTNAGSDAPAGTIELWLAGKGAPAPAKTTKKKKAKAAVPASGPTEAERAAALRNWLILQMKQQKY
ncbi:MAG: hypothetical protein WBC90_01095 [Albidovulum sp.]